MTKPLERMLDVFECVAQNGPITLSEMGSILPFSRASIWRMLSVLRGRGWVRMKRGGYEFVVREDIVKKIRTSEFSPMEVSRIDPVINAITSLRKKGKLAFHVQYGIFTGLGVFEVIEDTSKNSTLIDSKYAISIVWESIAIAAQSRMENCEIHKHTDEYTKIACQDEANIIDCGKHMENISKCRLIGYVFCPILKEISLSCQDITGRHGALRISQRPNVTMTDLEFKASILNCLETYAKLSNISASIHQSNDSNEELSRPMVYSR